MFCTFKIPNSRTILLINSLGVDDNDPPELDSPGCRGVGR